MLILVILSALSIFGIREEKIVLKVMTYDKGGGKDLAQFYQNMVDTIPEFRERMNSKGKKYDIKFEMIAPDDETLRLKQALDLASGSAADVLILNPPTLAEFVEAGHLYDLTDKLAEWTDWTNYTKVAKESVCYKGRYYGLPVGMYSSAISYRKDLFAQVDLPKNWQPRNLDEIIQAAITLKTRFPKMDMPINMPIGTQWALSASIETMLPLIWGYGGDIYNPNTNKWIGRSPEIFKVAKWLREIFIEKKLSSVSINRNPDPWSATIKMFQKGENAIFISTTGLESWAFGPGADFSLPDVRNQLGYAALPGSGEVGAPAYTGFCDSYIFVINRESKEPEAAFDFLKLANSAERVARVSDLGNVLPTRIDSQLYTKYTNNPRMRELNWILNYSRSYPIHEDFPKVDSLLQNLGDQILDGVNPQTAINKFFNEMVRELGNSNVEDLLK
jgi:multiple sugar transport system substrate-binding protein